jgi:hypothetical protein
VVAGDPPARRRKASISIAPYISPEASPAEIRIRTEDIVKGDGCSRTVARDHMASADPAD